MTEMEYETMQKEFSKLRSDNEALRRFLLNAQTESDTREAALESAVAALDRADNFADKLVADAMAKGRALAMEEAARLTQGLLAMGFHKSVIPDRVRLLAPLPASLVAVPRETMGMLREAIEDMLSYFGSAWEGGSIERGRLRAALALLDEVSK